MRNSNSTSVTRSSSSTTHHHPQLLTHTAIADGYDFNRARSSESTENARAPGKVVSTTAAAAAAPTTAPASSDFGETSSSVSFGSSATAEDRGVPVSPKKLPPTPPRDHGSPYRPAVPPQENHHRASAGFGLGLWQPTMASTTRTTGATPRLPSQSQSQSRPPPFLRPSSWRAKEEDHGASIFRPSPVLLSDPPSLQLSREHERYYTIQSSLAFDEDDDFSDDDEHA